MNRTLSHATVRRVGALTLATAALAIPAVAVAAPLSRSSRGGTTPSPTTTTSTTPATPTTTSTTPTTTSTTPTTTSTTPTTTSTTPTSTTPTSTTPTTTTPIGTKPPKKHKKHKPKPKPKPNPKPPKAKPKPTPKPQPKPAQASPSVYLGGLFTVGGKSVTVPGRAVSVTGVVRPYVPGQGVLVKEFVGNRLIAQKKLALKPSKRKVYGGFTINVTSPAAGTVSIVVEHSRNAHMLSFETHSSFATLAETVGPGATGPLVQLIQQRLAALHFYIPQTGVYDLGTELAVDAYHRLLGTGFSQLMDPGTLTQLLNGTGSFHVRFPSQGRHAEGDLSDQLLALTDGSNVQLIFPISSGKPSTPTVLGSWQVYSRVPGYLPDGMYFSDFFIRGYAIHGYDPAPDYPASHGCMRLPIVDAITAFNWLAIGDWVDTYYT